MTPGPLGPRHGRAPRHPKDFPPQADAPTILYRLYDASGALLYIGITSNKANRFKKHWADSPWWKQVARKEFQTFPNRAEAVTAERVAVLAEKPKHNVEHTCPKAVRVPLDAAQQQKLTAIAVKTGMTFPDVIRKLIDDHA